MHPATPLLLHLVYALGTVGESFSFTLCNQICYCIDSYLKWKINDLTTLHIYNKFKRLFANEKQIIKQILFYLEFYELLKVNT